MENPASRDGYEWRQLLDEALVEVAPDKLKLKVSDAEAAVFQRFQALGIFDGEERLALQDASALLLTLKKEALGFPAWGPQKKESSVHPDGDERQKKAG